MKIYESPEFEIVKVTLSDNMLNVSQGEYGQGSGVINGPGEKEEP